MQPRFRKAVPPGARVCVSKFVPNNYELTGEVDPGYCNDLCCTFDREQKVCMKTSWGPVPEGYCGMSIPYKIEVIKREQDRAKPWMQRYMTKLLHKQGAEA